MSCPDADTMCEFVAARLVPEAVATIDQHIDECVECADLIAALARVGGSDDDATRVIGDRYELVDVVGRGAAGEVYVAFDRQLDRHVALKLLLDESPSDLLRGRFLREARAMAGLAHPNIVPVFDVGDFDGSSYVTMELVEGTTLSGWLSSADPDVADVLQVMAQAAAGLAAAHRAGYVHRDFKPANVLVGNDDRVRVADFGLVGLLGETASMAAGLRPGLEQVELTQTGYGVGTPAYMAPEQFAGVAVNARADQFSFCVTLYEALYGERPFRGTNLAELALDVRLGLTRKLPSRPRVPLRIRQLLQRGLRADPNDRHESMDVIAALLRAPARRRGAVALVVAGVGVVAAVGVVWALSGAGVAAHSAAPVDAQPTQPVVASKPTATKPIASKPTASKPTASKPTASKPTASKPIASKPITSKPITKKRPPPKRPIATRQPTANTSSTVLPWCRKIAALYCSAEFKATEKVATGAVCAARTKLLTTMEALPAASVVGRDAACKRMYPGYAASVASVIAARKRGAPKP